mmetsp:Transcript_52695/g.138207  ORF Transcript_52695/g.138207 Transcript_52695/m.138207 type:complete len:217 (+) Transcript_52695:65-715(+)
MPAKIAFPSSVGLVPTEGLKLGCDGAKLKPAGDGWLEPGRDGAGLTRPGRTGRAAPGTKPDAGSIGRGNVMLGYVGCGGRAAAAAFAAAAFARCVKISLTLPCTNCSALATVSGVPGPTVTVAGCPSFFCSTCILQPASAVINLMYSPPRPISPPTQTSSTCITLAGSIGPPAALSEVIMGPPIFSWIKRSAAFRSSMLLVALDTIARLYPIILLS